MLALFMILFQLLCKPFEMTLLRFKVIELFLVVFNYIFNPTHRFLFFLLVAFLICFFLLYIGILMLNSKYLKSDLFRRGHNLPEDKETKQFCNRPEDHSWPPLCHQC